MIDDMPEKTGKSLSEWKKILKEKSFAKHSESVKYLKTAFINQKGINTNKRVLIRAL